MQQRFPMSRKLAALSLLATSLMLAACGGAPSDSDIKSAVQKQVDQDQAAMRKMAGSAGADLVSSLTPQVKDIKKIGCTPDGEKAYKCDVELTLKHNGQEQKVPTSVRFVKTSDGWSASR